jgi:hypothetical protein
MGWWKKLTGVKKLEEELLQQVNAKHQQLQQEEEQLKAAKQQLEAEEEQLLKKKDPKAYATKKGEPWIGVLETHINKDNIRNGFFELDWNQYFVQELRTQGYGLEGDPDEEVVDRWFRTLCKDVANEDGIDMTDRGTGFINVQKLDDGKAEIS